MKSFLLFAVGLIVGAPLVLFFSASVAFGQTDPDSLSRARACMSIQDDADRLACLDSALVSDSGSAQPQVTEADSSAASSRREVEPSVETSPTVAPGSANDIADADADADAAERPIRVVDVQRNDFGVTTFLTESGETWVQRSGTRGRFPPVPFDAILQPAMGDTYFLQSPLGGPRARVEAMR